jgi:hypothetical protein
MDILIEAIREHCLLLWQNVSGVPSHFGSNLDEVGDQEQADAGHKIRFVLSIHGNDFVYRVFNPPLGISVPIGLKQKFWE